ncbi:MAG: type II toxin-antitoxin system VapC family toxin [Akkermansiaceae bacterium]|jgi:toxin FitB|nr:type II toxin-antitoxin system VapC family toxin [Akkermansiaceae bacterium]MDP4645634.1 type II toxin-antitoxin system VapC family toxin [Akkermansiaceae bacterium]MDP4721532.1 type II toxin-antitoxin system VapC family toxin [Akkermansiaceae bacterium]MDP4778742.1 type II toxin-antitoxin system VapC family toxin [Akkermansiaceae bacterium]MDP4847449.1 type II toxin-antitoxin system VapC family toxin [Akkermansiaceae bacterium]
MPGFLIDTNVLSEIRKGATRAEPGVWAWWLSARESELFLSVMTLGEIRKGIDRLARRDLAQATGLENWLEGLKNHFSEHIIEISAAIGDRWGQLQAVRPLPEIDALIAATALDKNLALVTRNEADFTGLGLRVLNPFPGAD